MKIAVNFNNIGEHKFQVAELLEKAIREMDEVELVRVGDKADIIVNTLPDNGFSTSATVKALWDLETAEYQMREYFDSADLIFYPNHKNVDVYDNYKDRSYFLPLATDPKLFHYYEEPINYDIGFIGREDSNREIRVEGLNVLQEYCEKKGYKMLRTNHIPRGEETSRLTSQCKITIQIAGLRNLEQRVFETAAIRPLMADRQEDNKKEMDMTVKQHKHYIPFYYKSELAGSQDTDWSDMLKQLDYYLEHKEEREEIVENARKHMFEHHTYQNRVQRIVDIVKKKGWL